MAAPNKLVFRMAISNAPALRSSLSHYAYIVSAGAYSDCEKVCTTVGTMKVQEPGAGWRHDARIASHAAMPPSPRRARVHRGS